MSLKQGHLYSPKGLLCGSLEYELYTVKNHRRQVGRFDTPPAGEESKAQAPRSDRITISSVASDMHDSAIPPAQPEAFPLLNYQKRRKRTPALAITEGQKKKKAILRIRIWQNWRSD